MEREVIDNADLAHFAEIGLVIFVIVFVLIILRVVFMKKDYSDKMKNMPLDEGQQDQNNPREVEA